MELATVDSRDDFKINLESERIVILDSRFGDSRNSIVRVMKYNGDFNKDWLVNTYHRYKKEVENTKTGKMEIKHDSFRDYCDVSGIGWISADSLRVNFNCNYVDSDDTFYFGDVGTSIGYINDFSNGDYEINFDEFNKVISIKFIDLNDNGVSVSE